MSRHYRIGLLVGVLALGVVGAGVLVVPGCGPKGGGGAKLKVAIFNFPGYMPVRLAETNKFFDGVEVEVVRIEDTTARRAALSSGSVDGSVDILDSFTCARASGTAATVVLKIDDSLGADGIVAKKDVKSVRDLRGKTVAFARDQPSHFFLVALLEKEGMTMKDIVAKPMEDADKAGNAFVAGQVDAAVTWEPFLTNAKNQPNGHVVVSSKETPGLIVDVFVVRDEVLKARPEAVAGFLKGWFRAVEHWKAHPDDANKVMAGAMDLTPADFAAQVSGLKYADLAENKAFFGKGADGKSRFTRLVDQANTVWMREGVTNKAVDPASIDGSSLVLGLP